MRQGVAVEDGFMLMVLGEHWNLVNKRTPVALETVFNVHHKFPTFSAFVITNPYSQLLTLRAISRLSFYLNVGFMELADMGNAEAMKILVPLRQTNHILTILNI